MIQYGSFIIINHYQYSFMTIIYYYDDDANPKLWLRVGGNLMVRVRVRPVALVSRVRVRANPKLWLRVGGLEVILGLGLGLGLWL
jgi:hypothetical protein